MSHMLYQSSHFLNAVSLCDKAAVSGMSCVYVVCFVSVCVHVISSLPVSIEEQQTPCKGDMSMCRPPVHNDSSSHVPVPGIPHCSYNDTFLRFMETWGKKYPAGSQLSQDRYQAFLKSLERHWILNADTNDTAGAFYGINLFSDLSVEEFTNTFLRSYPLKSLDYYVPYTKGEKTLPLRFDWRDKQLVTEVKNQLDCGACWAFSIVGAIESVHAIKGNQLEDLSVQQVIDCSDSDRGCNGGSTDSALNWLSESHTKLVRASEYPFKAKTGTCHYFPLTKYGVSIKGYKAYDFSNCEEEMMDLLIRVGPLAVIVDAVSWQDYLGGIIQHHCSSGHSNHAVLVVGFDKSGDIPYWIVKNSWGTSWGVDGYVHVKMGQNLCEP
ncbi:cathepsin O isoform X2 [Hyla sarda]|uniref:cathepsin O isoform X2 n=1 Tax=Hyla sarda TaxID=327740 RepID=UPI0024C46360|nr:cathepsin O isoform X2 [Hyla sarda]